MYLRLEPAVRHVEQRLYQVQATPRGNLLVAGEKKKQNKISEENRIYYFKIYDKHINLETNESKNQKNAD